MADLVFRNSELSKWEGKPQINSCLAPWTALSVENIVAQILYH